jgi:hypothetical protein
VSIIESSLPHGMVNPDKNASGECDELNGGRKKERERKREKEKKSMIIVVPSSDRLTA